MSNSKFREGDFVEYHGAVSPNSCSFANENIGLCGTVDRVTTDGVWVWIKHIANSRFWCNENIRKIAPPITSAERALRDPQPQAGRLLSHALPTDSTERKRWPMFGGLLAYFPAALAQVSNHSFVGNEKHNPGKPLQHARGKSSDHEDCIVRHLVDAAEFPRGSQERIEELRAECWRSLALLQEECELAGAPHAPAATFDAKQEA